MWLGVAYQLAGPEQLNHVLDACFELLVWLNFLLNWDQPSKAGDLVSLVA
jgi:hypothetical protein